MFNEGGGINGFLNNVKKKLRIWFGGHPLSWMFGPHQPVDVTRYGLTTNYYCGGALQT